MSYQRDDAERITEECRKRLQGTMARLIDAKANISTDALKKVVTGQMKALDDLFDAFAPFPVIDIGNSTYERILSEMEQEGNICATNMLLLEKYLFALTCLKDPDVIMMVIEDFVNDFAPENEEQARAYDSLCSMFEETKEMRTR